MKILDTNYKIKIFDKYKDEGLEVGECIGYCDFDTKVIAVLNDYRVKETFIHEIVHAFLYEMSLEHKSYDEELVDTITSVIIRIMKLLKVWDKWKVGK